MNCSERIHQEHQHQHGEGCGHAAIQHRDHVDYAHDGHMHHLHGDHFDEHSIAESTLNPAVCTSGHSCVGHEVAHLHGIGCGHEAVTHGSHVDYIVADHLHYADAGHCDDHGLIVRG